MSESRDNFCSELKAKFPEVEKLANLEYQKQWADYDDEFYSYTWFEALANALNGEMQKLVKPEKYTELFEFIRFSYMTGTEDVKKTIDVAFVENLFWQIPPEKAKPYWEKLPDILKDLYIGFHQRRP
ncbi:DUF7674 family protein [Gynuella sp.]|uniref:DUF7674 family protein n=1 Tax=Gynuella sp. TaxID=2969146 RepID=UPI003D139B86